MSLTTTLLNLIKDYPDFPQPGIIFKDINPVLRHSQVFKQMIQKMAESAAAVGAEQIVGIESRGFILAAPVALELNCPFVPARKKGKLPGKVASHCYSLEYGSDTLEIQQEAFAPQQKNYIIDDVLATGGTAAAVTTLIHTIQQAQVVGLGFLLELAFLQGRNKILQRDANLAIHSLLIINQ